MSLLKKEGSETVTNCNAFKLRAADGKMRLTDVADTEQLFRVIQSIPSPKAEPFKQWMAQVASQRIDQMISPSQALFWVALRQQSFLLPYHNVLNSLENSKLKSIFSNDEITFHSQILTRI